MWKNGERGDWKTFLYEGTHLSTWGENLVFIIMLGSDGKFNCKTVVPLVLGLHHEGSSNIYSKMTAQQSTQTLKWGRTAQTTFYLKMITPPQPHTQMLFWVVLEGKNIFPRFFES